MGRIVTRHMFVSNGGCGPNSDVILNAPPGCVPESGSSANAGSPLSRDLAACRPQEPTRHPCGASSDGVPKGAARKSRSDAR